MIKNGYLILGILNIIITVIYAGETYFYLKELSGPKEKNFLKVYTFINVSVMALISIVMVIIYFMSHLDKKSIE